MVIQFEYLLLRVDYNIQWLGEALVKVDQHLQPWKLVNLQKHSPHANIENILLCCGVTKMMRETGDSI